jgi:hypothetical protein
MEVVFCDNRVVTVGGDGTFEELSLEVTELAQRRHAERRNSAPSNREQTANH